MDFDHHSDEYARESRHILERMRRDTPIAWTPHYGGSWIVTRYEDVARVFRDTVTFTTHHDMDNDGSSYTGTTLPEMPFVKIPLEMDGPEFLAYRKVLIPAFAPRAVERLRGRITEFATWAIDEFIEKGRADVGGEFAARVPALSTLELLGLPLQDWHVYSSVFHDRAGFPRGTPEHDRAEQAIGDIKQRLLEIIRQLRAEPRNDLVTAITRMTIGGEAISDQAVLGVVNLIIAGGVDTTTSLTLNALKHLDEDRSLRESLLAEPGLMESACEEFLRMYTPGPMHARTATKDTILSGTKIRAGERVVMSMTSANMDEAAFACPNEFRLDRPSYRHSSFGFGPHRCLGAHIARLEFKIMLGQVLKRLPGYRVLPSARRYPTLGQVNGWLTMPIAFTPGPRVGADLSPSEIGVTE